MIPAAPAAAGATAGPPTVEVSDPEPGPSDTPALWQPLDLSGVWIPNRLAVAPMSRVSTDGDGVPTTDMRQYYRNFAEGGFGLILTEGIYPVGAASQAYANQPGLVTPAQVSGWADITTAVHAAGGLILAQLMHAGALSQHLGDTLAPSAITPRGAKMPDYGGSGPYPDPAELTGEQIEELVAGFAASAVLAAEAGFDGVEVHAANGYLLDQFLTTYTNTRTGRYGGSAVARAQLTADVVRSIRARIPDHLLVGVRLSQAKVNDSRHKWLDRQEATDIFHTIADAAPDYLHLAGEGRPWTDSGKAADGTALGTLARREIGLPVIVNGGLHTPELIQHVLTSGEADMVSLARPALADPHWPARVRAGEPPQPFANEMISPSASLQNTNDYWNISSDTRPR